MSKEKITLHDIPLTIICVLLTLIVMLPIFLGQIATNAQQVHERLKALETDRQEQIDQREYEELIEIIIQEWEARQ